MYNSTMFLKIRKEKNMIGKENYTKDPNIHTPEMGRNRKMQWRRPMH